MARYSVVVVVVAPAVVAVVCKVGTLRVVPEMQVELSKVQLVSRGPIDPEQFGSGWFDPGSIGSDLVETLEQQWAQ